MVLSSGIVNRRDERLEVVEEEAVGNLAPRESIDSKLPLLLSVEDSLRLMMNNKMADRRQKRTRSQTPQRDLPSYPGPFRLVKVVASSSPKVGIFHLEAIRRALSPSH